MRASLRGNQDTTGETPLGHEELLGGTGIQKEKFKKSMRNNHWEEQILQRKDSLRPRGRTTGGNQDFKGVNGS